MDLGLSGRRAFVSGSTQGIGYGIARALAREGAEVVLNGRSRDRVEQAVRIIAADPAVSDAGGAVRGLVADLSVAAGAEQVLADLGDSEIDILVNSLGIYEIRAFAEIDDANWQRFFDVNVMSGVRVTRGLLPGMFERDWGRVLFVSSDSGVHIPRNQIHYGFSKAAQIAIARGLAESAEGTRVTVNSLLVGPTLSPTIEQNLERRAGARGISFEEMAQEVTTVMRPTSLIKRMADIDEIGRLAAFVCSDAGAVITGAAVRAEGGILSH